MKFFHLLLAVLFWIAPIYPQFCPEKCPPKTKLSNHYSPQFLRLLQIAFGNEEILSQGGYESIDILFGSLDLDDKMALDVGSGFGGVDIYLAQKFAVDVIGVDLEPYMVMTADNFLQKHKNSLIGHVSFQTLQQSFGLQEFEDNTFDVTFSKETFYNVPRANKQHYLSEIYRKLKPGGILIIADWFQSKPEGGEFLRRASTNEKICQFVTPALFRKMLEQVHFQEIYYVDQSKKHIQYTEEDCERLRQNASLIRKKFGEETYQKTVDAWKCWLEAQEKGELISGIFYAKKPMNLNFGFSRQEMEELLP